ncbi:hypothetical protein E1B28_007200 [Marasmius oreades]|nr:uncharacterized protein E1B28_007200 [Marasmius oreades]KAG7093527.1 hypothetical protein E1B28_007200 [Marasmius oreades]
MSLSPELTGKLVALGVILEDKGYPALKSLDFDLESPLQLEGKDPSPGAGSLLQRLNIELPQCLSPPFISGFTLLVK